MSEIKTYCVYLTREEISDATAHWIVAQKIRKASEFAETLQSIWEQMPEIFAFELYTHKQNVKFCFTAAAENIDKIQSALYVMIPDARIEEIDDFTFDYNDDDIIVTNEIKTVGLSCLPFNTYDDRSQDCATPLLNILSCLPANHKFIVQWVGKKIPDDWIFSLRVKLQQIEWLARFPFTPLHWFRPKVLERFQGSYKKCEEQVFNVNLRTAVIAPGPEDTDDLESRKAIEGLAKGNLQSILHGIQFTYKTMMGRYRVYRTRTGPRALLPFQARDLSKPFWLSKHEFGTQIHPVPVERVPQMAQALWMQGTPPSELPSEVDSPEISIFAHTHFRKARTVFGIKRIDRANHVHILGKSGSGKSKLLQLLMKSDIDHGHGLLLIDCHGDLVDETLQLVPVERVDDVVVVDFSDAEYAVTFNPFDNIPRAEWQYFSVHFMEVFRNIDGKALSETGERILRNAILAVLEVPETSLLSLLYMLIDEEYRGLLVDQLEPGSVRNFWEVDVYEQDELLQHPDMFRLIKILSRVVSINLTGHVFGQTTNKFDFRKMIEQNKIIFVKVPKKNLGRANAVLLGSLVLSMVHYAAASRAESDSFSNRDFYIYIDEFQNFATDSFCKALNEAKKNRISYTIAHQMINQLSKEVRDALTAKVGNTISFQLGGDDAQALVSRFSPPFGEVDLANLDARSFYIRMSINDALQEAFSGRTIDVVYPDKHYADDCIEQTRQKYAEPHSDLSGAILPFSTEMLDEQGSSIQES